MPNPLVALGVRGTKNTGRGVAQLNQNRRAAIAADQNQQQIDLQREQVQAAQLDARTKQRLDSTLQGLVGVTQFLEAGDTEGAQQFLRSRRQTLQGLGVPSNDTDEFDQMVKENPQQALTFARAQINAAERVGLLKPGPSRFAEVRDAQGNIVGQRNSVSGEVKSDPRASKLLSSEEFDQKVQLQGTVAALAAKARAEVEATSPQAKVTSQLLETQLQKTRLDVEKTRLANEKALSDAKTATDKKVLSADLARTKADNVIAKADQAIGQINDAFAATGIGGQVLSSIGGTSARDLASTLDTIKANLGFQELQQMRDASPTGGALGAISERELALLQSTLASLDQAQSAEQLIQNLNDIRGSIAKWRDAVNGINPDENNTQSIRFEDLQ